MQKTILCAALLCVSSTASMAADLTAPYAVSNENLAVPQTHNWTGFYAGVVGGYGAERSITHNAGNAKLDTDGALLGGTIGANWQTGNFVYGLEGDLSWSGQEGYAYPTTLTENYFATIRARAGYAFDNILLFTTTGVAVSNVHAVALGDKTDDSFYGWTVGGGAEYAFTQSLSAKIEYLYTKYGDKDIDLAGFTYDIGLSSSTVRAGLNYKF